MERRRLGRTGLQVSAIGFGGARLDEHPDLAMATVHRALDRGINFIDTARAYGGSEEHLGNALRGRRAQSILATKALIEDPDTTLQSLETSLPLLGTDAVDLFYAHACDNEERFAWTMRPGGALASLEQARARGLTRFIGISFNHFLPFQDGRSGVDRMKALIETDTFDVIQVPFSLIRIERVEQEVLPMAAARDIGVVINFPTADGLLTREWGVFRPMFEPYVATPCQAALLYLLLYPEVTCVLSGMSTPDIADENCAVGSIVASIPVPVRADLLRQVDALGLGPCRSCGRCAPYTHGIPVPQIMTYHDAERRFGIQAARQRYESYRDQVMACSSFEGADAVCPEGFDVLAEVKRAYA
ncbi:MAG: aldo/keto reductase [Candidatus Latescibacteria bacterium]|nr:aldo/keto reductase [Candidatus Latescibacterota bacterium]